MLAGLLVEMGVRGSPSSRSVRLTARDRDAWLRRLQSEQRSRSTISAYRIAIDDLLAGAQERQRSGKLFEERAIVDYLADYRQARRPEAATYYRRFVPLRRFMAWVCRRQGTPDPFLELQAPAKPHQERDWVTREKFDRLLAAAACPQRARPGNVQRDRLVLLTFAVTGLRRAELIEVTWGDLDLDGPTPSLLVRHGEGGKPRRQPLPSQLVAELHRRRAVREPMSAQHVFCGFERGRLQPTALARITKRVAAGAGLEKHLSAHTLRHTAATWLRQSTGDTRLVAEYLGHADLSTVSRYAHVTSHEMQTAVEMPGDHSGQPSFA